MLKISQLLLQGLTKHFHLLRLLQGFLRDALQDSNRTILTIGPSSSQQTMWTDFFFKKCAFSSLLGPRQRLLLPRPRRPPLPHEGGGELCQGGDAQQGQLCHTQPGGH